MESGNERSPETQGRSSRRPTGAPAEAHRPENVCLVVTQELRQSGSICPTADAMELRTPRKPSPNQPLFQFSGRARNNKRQLLGPSKLRAQAQRSPLELPAD